MLFQSHLNKSIVFSIEIDNITIKNATRTTMKKFKIRIFRRRVSPKHIMPNRDNITEPILFFKEGFPFNF